MKRRNSQNLTFEDMMLYNEFISNREEAVRLREQTKNIWLNSALNDFISNMNKGLELWLEEEV